MLYGVKATVNGKEYIYGSDRIFYPINNINKLYTSSRLATAKATATMADTTWSYDANTDQYYHWSMNPRLTIEGIHRRQAAEHYRFDKIEAVEIKISF